MSLSNLLKLIYNELIKIFLRRSTWVMFAIIIILVIGSAILNYKMPKDNFQANADEDWRIQLEQENEKIMEAQKKLEQSEDIHDEIWMDFDMEKYEINSFYLKENLKPAKFGAWAFVHDVEFILSFITLFTIIIAANIVSVEHQWGTIKLLLIRPIHRQTIWFSKFLSMLGFAIITVIFLFLFSFLTGLLFFGLESGSNPHAIIFDLNDTMRGVTISEEYSYLKYASLPMTILKGYSFHLVILVMMASFALMISTIFKNNALAIGVAIFLMFAGNSIVLFLEDYSWAKYILFANIDLSQYVNNNPMFEGMTLKSSIIVLLIHFVLFISISSIIFVKRDITD